jgi:tetratricopeptide (TPR) repeat protein
MKKKLLLTLWLLVPILLLAYHYGPGQRGLAREQVAAKIAAAQAAEQAEDWFAAIDAYTEALAALPAEEKEVRAKLQLAKAKARMYAGELPEAMIDMEGLLVDLLKDKADAKLVREVRANLGSAQYYAAWLMRLEGATADEWTVEVEQARQNFRLLAEETRKEGDQAATLDHKKNLEASIRLARMDLSELQGLPLPKQCKGCKNCSQKCRKQRESKCQNPGEKEPKDARGAGSGKRPDGTGS